MSERRTSSGHTGTSWHLLIHVCHNCSVCFSAACASGGDSGSRCEGRYVSSKAPDSPARKVKPATDFKVSPWIGGDVCSITASGPATARQVCLPTRVSHGTEAL